MSSTDSKKRTVKCPGCKRPLTYDLTNPFRPFCGPRCKEFDIAAWASEVYRVPVALSETGVEDALPEEDEEP